MNSTKPFNPDSTLSAGSFQRLDWISWGNLSIPLAHSPASLGTVFKMIPSYGKHFTQPPSFQLRLFLGCNHLCLIFKVLANFRFLIIRSSVTSDPLIRSRTLYNGWNRCYIKILYQNCRPMTDKPCPCFREGLFAWVSRAIYKPRPDVDLGYNAGLPCGKLTRKKL